MGLKCYQELLRMFPCLVLQQSATITTDILTTILQLNCADEMTLNCLISYYLSIRTNISGFHRQSRKLATRSSRNLVISFFPIRSTYIVCDLKANLFINTGLMKSQRDILKRARTFYNFKKFINSYDTWRFWGRKCLFWQDFLNEEYRFCAH